MLQNRTLSPRPPQRASSSECESVTLLCVYKHVHMLPGTHKYLTRYKCWTVETAVSLQSFLIRLLVKPCGQSGLSSHCHLILLSSQDLELYYLWPTPFLLLCPWQNWSFSGIIANILIEDLCVCGCSKFTLWNKGSWLAYTDISKWSPVSVHNCSYKLVKCRQ